MISEDERKSMLRAHSIGPKMLGYLEEIGVERLADLKGADPLQILPCASTSLSGAST